MIYYEDSVDTGATIGLSLPTHGTPMWDNVIILYPFENGRRWMVDGFRYKSVTGSHKVSGLLK